MRFQVERDDLVDAINWVSRSLSTKVQQPELLGILITVSTSITLRASDFETTSTSLMKAEIAETGEVLVPGRLLVDIAKALPNKLVSFKLEGSRVLVSAGSAKFILPTLSANDFPSLPELPETSGVFDAEVFAQAVAQVAIAASKDDSLSKLTGLNVEIDKDKITFAATDRYRLAVAELKWSPADPNISGATLVRARTLQEVAKSLNQTSAISLHLSNPNSGHERLIGFNAELKTLVTRTLNDTFHAYAHLLTKDWKFEAVVEVAPLLEAARRVALVTDKTVPLKLTFTSNSVLLEASGQDEASAVEEIDAMFSGESLTIAFNPGYLIEGLQALNYQYVHFDLIDSRTHSVFTGQADQYSAKDESYKYLLMPMHYNS